MEQNISNFTITPVKTNPGEIYNQVYNLFSVSFGYGSNKDYIDQITEKLTDVDYLQNTTGGVTDIDSIIKNNQYSIVTFKFNTHVLNMIADSDMELKSLIDRFKTRLMANKKDIDALNKIGMMKSEKINKFLSLNIINSISEPIELVTGKITVYNKNSDEYYSMEEFGKRVRENNLDGIDTSKINEILEEMFSKMKENENELVNNDEDNEDSDKNISPSSSVPSSVPGMGLNLNDENNIKKANLNSDDESINKTMFMDHLFEELFGGKSIIFEATFDIILGKYQDNEIEYRNNLVQQVDIISNSISNIYIENQLKLVALEKGNFQCEYTLNLIKEKLLEYPNYTDSFATIETVVDYSSPLIIENIIKSKDLVFKEAFSKTVKNGYSFINKALNVGSNLSIKILYTPSFSNNRIIDLDNFAKNGVFYVELKKIGKDGKPMYKYISGNRKDIHIKVSDYVIKNEKALVFSGLMSTPLN